MDGKLTPHTIVITALAYAMARRELPDLHLSPCTARRIVLKLVASQPDFYWANGTMLFAHGEVITSHALGCADWIVDDTVPDETVRMEPQ